MGERIKAKKLDLLNGPIWNKIPQFALPVAATGILEQLFNASDLAIVGNFVNTDRTVAVAAVGANSPIIGMILNLFFVVLLGRSVDGVAIATVISNAVSSLILFYRLLRTDKWIRLSLFNSDPQVIELGYTRLVLIFIALMIYRPSKRYQELEK